jgi:hypothetical protein
MNFITSVLFPSSSLPPLHNPPPASRRTVLLFQIERPTYRANDTLRLSASIAPTTATLPQLHTYANTTATSFSSTSSTIKECTCLSPPALWKDVDSLRVTVQGRLHVLRPASVLSTGPTSTFQTTRTIYQSTTQIIVSPQQGQQGQQGQQKTSVPPLAHDKTTLVQFQLPPHLPPTCRGHYFALRYSVNIQCCDQDQTEMGRLRIPVVLRGIGEVANATAKELPSSASVRVLPFVPHRLFNLSSPPHGQAEDGANSTGATSFASPNTPNTSSSGNGNGNGNEHMNAMSLSHLRICSHEDEVIEMDEYHQIPRNQHRLNNTLTFCAKSTSGNQEVFITLYNTLPRASESITVRFDYVKGGCGFVCVALLQHESIELVPTTGGNDDNSTDGNGNEKEPPTTTSTPLVKTSTLAAWHETTTHAMSSWCTLNVPEDAVTFHHATAESTPSLPLRVAMTHSLKFQFHLKNANVPLTCQVPIVVSSEWRPPLNNAMDASVSFGGRRGGGLGAARWSVVG